MIKRQWPPVLFIIAFAISLAHASIPHSHPDPIEESHRHSHAAQSSNLSHSHDSKSEHHDHSHNHSDQDHKGSDRPVFSHFSNADYLGNSFFEFQVKGKHLIELVQPVTVGLNVPFIPEKHFLFPRARDLPSSRHRSSESLRAPPFFS